MQGWIIPPPREPTKSKNQFKKEREEKVRWLIRHGYLRSERIRNAMLKVRRENFIPTNYRDYAYREVPLPLPGEQATISCPHSYPLFYEPLGLDKGHRFLEIGLGSGYGTALAREIVGSTGLVACIELDPLTFEFGKENLQNAGYDDIVLIRGDGGFGYPEMAPYDRVCITAASHDIPPPLIEQLIPGGKLIGPLVHGRDQDLVLLEKKPKGLREKVICQVLYVPLRGEFGT